MLDVEDFDIIACLKAEIIEAGAKTDTPKKHFVGVIKLSLVFCSLFYKLHRTSPLSCDISTMSSETFNCCIFVSFIITTIISAARYR